MKTPKKRQGRSPVWFPIDLKRHLEKAENHLALAIQSHVEAAEDSKAAGDIWTLEEGLEYRVAVRQLRAVLKTVQNLSR